MYTQINEEVYQGDILENFDFIVPPLGKPFAFLGKNVEPVLIDETEAPATKIISNTLATKGLIITQTCDIQRRKYIAVCPIFTVESLISELRVKGRGENRIQNFLVDLRSQKVGYHLHLPATSISDYEFPESYVDLQLINSMPTENISLYRRIFSLSDLGRHRLSFQIINLFSRPI